METIQPINTVNRRNMTLPITAKLKEVLSAKETKIGAAVSLVAGTVFVSARYFSPILETEPTHVAEICSMTETEVCDTAGSYIQTDICEVMAPENETQSFDDLFEVARNVQGPGGIFEYKGELYNTFFKEEWESMSDADKDSYYSSISEKIDNEAKLILSDGQGNITTLTYDHQNLLNIEVVDTDADGIVDIAAIDVNFDGIVDYEVGIEKEVVLPTGMDSNDGVSTVVDAGSNGTINDNDITDIDKNDITLVNDTDPSSMEEQNVFDDQEIGKFQLPGIIDDMDMSEFQ
jgi:hypothetical protein